MLKDADHYYAPKNFTPSIFQSHAFGWFRRTRWDVMNRNATLGHFVSIWFFGKLQIYFGTAKCDGSESHAEGKIVMVDSWKERYAFRWRASGPGLLSWDNMGGS